MRAFVSQSQRAASASAAPCSQGTPHRTDRRRTCLLAPLPTIRTASEALSDPWVLDIPEPWKSNFGLFRRSSPSPPPPREAAGDALRRASDLAGERPQPTAAIAVPAASPSNMHRMATASWESEPSVWNGNCAATAALGAATTGGATAAFAAAADAAYPAPAGRVDDALRQFIAEGRLEVLSAKENEMIISEVRDAPFPPGRCVAATVPLSTVSLLLSPNAAQSPAAVALCRASQLEKFLSRPSCFLPAALLLSSPHPTPPYKGERCPYIFIVFEGVVRCEARIAADGGQLLASALPGHLLGLVAYLSDPFTTAASLESMLPRTQLQGRAGAARAAAEDAEDWTRGNGSPCATGGGVFGLGGAALAGNVRGMLRGSPADNTPPGWELAMRSRRGSTERYESEASPPAALPPPPSPVRFAHTRPVAFHPCPARRLSSACCSR